MAIPRNSIPDFEVANAAYSLSEVTVFIANPDGSKGALATLYSGLTGLGTLPNPQTLDNTGKWQQPVYIDSDSILQINSPLDPLLDHDTGIVRFGGRWRGVWTGPGTRYNIDDLILGPVGEPEESNVYRSQSIWASTGVWADDVADATLMVLELDYQALRTLALGALPDADETTKGKIEIATQAETNTGTDDVRAVTPLKLASRTATETRAGIAEVATQTEVNTGANDTHIVTPAKLKAMAASETLTGIAAIATQAEVNAGSNNTKMITPAKLTGRPAFFVFKSGDQTATSATDVTVTWENESYDTGNYFASNAWTPPAGIYRLSVMITLTNANAVDNEVIWIEIRKNGVANRQAEFKRGSTTEQTFVLTSDVSANGTDVFTVVVNKGGAGNGAILATGSRTNFCGGPV